MHPSQVGVRALAVQMLREACILEALSHPGVPRVYECGVLADKRPWVALELTTGAALTDAMTAGPMPVSDVVAIFRALAEILEHAHGRGVVHHRVTEHVVTRTTDRPFPVCLRGWGEVATHDSQRGVDPHGDIEALGMLALRMLAGSDVARGTSAQAAFPELPAELTRLIDEMLAAPIQRPSSEAVHARITWIAQTFELVPTLRPRWAPGQPPTTPIAPRTISDFSVRIKS
jgi:hypothetical protein